VHRIGRTARAGAAGRAIGLVDEASALNLEAIEKFIGQKIPVEWAEDDLFVAEIKPSAEERRRFAEERRARLEARRGSIAALAAAAAAARCSTRRTTRRRPRPRPPTASDAGAAGAAAAPAARGPGRQPMTRIAIIDDWGAMVSAQAIWRRLEGRARIDAFQDTLASEDALAERLAPYEIIVPTRERTFFRAGLLGRLPTLRMIAIGGRFTGQVDLAAAAAKGIAVTDTEGSGVNAFEHTVALMMALVRRVPQEDRATREGRWQTPPIGVDMYGKTLGIIGLGRIGGKMAAFGRLLGMRVLATGITLTDERAAAAGVTRVDLDTLLRESDVVSVHYRLSDKTRGLITARHLSLMKPGAFLVNTARGRSSTSGPSSRRCARAVSPAPPSTCSTSSRCRRAIRCSRSTTWS